MNQTINVLRKALAAILTFGLFGLGAELILLGHTEGPYQKIPLVLIGAGLSAMLAHGLVRKTMTVRILQVVMGLLILGGLIGLYLHYDGNMEFELEMMPSLGGWELFRSSMTGATPTLAPGALIQLGLIGLVFTYRHPVLTSRNLEKQ